MTYWDNGLSHWGDMAFTATFQSLPTSASTSIDPTMWKILKVIKMLFIRLRAVFTRLMDSEQSQGHSLSSNFYWISHFYVDQFLISLLRPCLSLKAVTSAGGEDWRSSLKDQAVKNPLWKDCRFRFVPHETILGNYLLTVPHLVRMDCDLRDFFLIL